MAEHTAGHTPEISAAEKQQQEEDMMVRFAGLMIQGIEVGMFQYLMVSHPEQSYLGFKIPRQREKEAHS